MSQRLHQLLDRVVWVVDFETVESSAGTRYMIDRGPNGFHFAFPGGAADPTEQLDGSYYFDNGDYLALPAAQLARFYTKLPTREHTWIVGAKWATASIDAVFSCHGVTGGNSFGLLLLLNTSRLACYTMQGGAPQPYAQTAAGSYGAVARRYNGIFSIETSPVATKDGQIDTLAWGAGAFGTTVYDPAFSPTIGKYATAASNYLHGSLYYLALLSGAVDLPTQLEIQRYLMTGRKPFCERHM